MRCKGCGAHGVKLWREYQMLPTSLLCTTCAEKEQGAKRDGDSIGRRIPAVTVNGQPGVFWSFCAVPDDDANEWRALPEVDVSAEQRELAARCPLGGKVVDL